MSNYRRYFVPGGTYFFTLVAYRRRAFLTTELARQCLREALMSVRNKRPMEIPAFVLLPDHLHAMWTLGWCSARSIGNTRPFIVG